MAYETELENINSRLIAAGVKLSEKESKEVAKRFGLLVTEWHVPTAEAVRTVIQGTLKAHGIETRVWSTGGTAASVLVDQIKSDNEWISLKAKIVQIWDNRSDAVARTGLIGDGTGVIKFTVFQKNEDIIPKGFQEGASFEFKNFVSSVWQGQISVKGNKNSVIVECEPIEASRRTDEVVGVITQVLSGSGLIKRCPECNRALVKGTCGEHGKVEGLHDIRIKALMSEYGSNEQLELIIGREPTEIVMDMTVAQAKDIAMEQMDTGVIGDMMRNKLTGRYYRAVGSIMQSGGVIVESLTPASVLTEEALECAISEAGD